MSRTSTIASRRPDHGSLEVQVFESPEGLAGAVARDICDILAGTLRRRGRALMTASTGRTFIDTYRILRLQYARRLDWRRVTLVQMDEYATSTGRRGGSLAAELRRELAGPLGMGMFVALSDTGAPCPRRCRRRDDLVRSLGGLDLAVHGIGRNGHVGFNEPGCRRSAPSRIVTLAPETREANFGDDPTAPRRGLTLGMDMLGRARHSLLAACGPLKSAAVSRLLAGDPPQILPAAVIRRSPIGRVYLDLAAYQGAIIPPRPTPGSADRPFAGQDS